MCIRDSPYPCYASAFLSEQISKICIVGYAGSCHKKGAYEEPDEDLILKQILHFYALFLPCRRRFRLSHHEKCRYDKSRRIQIKDSLKSSVLSVFSYDKRGYCITCGACPSYYRICLLYTSKSGRPRIRSITICSFLPAGFFHSSLPAL